MRWTSPYILSLIRLAMAEDATRHDITTQALIPKKLKIEARIQAKGHGVVCGLPMAGLFFKNLDSHCRFIPRKREGQVVKPGDTLATLHGSARTILSGERSALNALQHLSGVATYTRQQVKHLKSKRTAIYDTRKTLPGWRELEKYAVRCGGGKNHRISLAAGILIKDNHLQISRLIGNNWQKAIQQFRRKSPHTPIEMEIQTKQDLRDALKLHPDQILLDNMSLAELRAVLKQVRRGLPGIEVEVSGGVQSEQIASLSRLGVERISMGRLTHSAPAFDCALEITRVLHAR